MGIFYDPIKKKPQSWVFIMFICVPILLLVFGFIWGKTKAKKNAAEEKELTPNEFFNKFEVEKPK